MSIFASTSGPSLISIPTFTSPVHPQNQDPKNDSTREGGSPLKALTRAEERQKRFRNSNTQWDSLTRMIEQQKSNSSQSLLHLMAHRASSSTAAEGKGKGKEVEGGVEKRKSTRGGAEVTKGTSKDGLRSGKSPSPRKRKRETSKLEGKSDNVGAGGVKRSKEDDNIQKATKKVEVGFGKEVEHSSRGGTSESKSTNPLGPPVQPLASSSNPLTTSNGPITTSAISKPRGRAPRAAMRRPLENADSVPSTSNYLVPPSRSPPRSPPVPSYNPVPITQAAPLVNSKPVEAPKKRRKPRAAPPTPAASRLRKPSPEPEDRELQDTSIEVIPDSQVEVDTGSKGGKATAETEDGSKKATGLGKKRKVVMDSTVDVDGIRAKESSPKKKVKVVEETRSKSKAAVERGVNEGKATEANEKKGATAKAQKMELTKIEASTEKKGKKGKKAKEVVTLSSSPPASPQPKKATKRSKPVVPPPSSSPVHSPAVSSNRSSAPPLLSSPPTSKTKSTKSKAKQHLVRSERLETDSSQDGKVNVYDVIIGGAKSVLKDVLEDLDEDDAADQAKIQALKQYVASFRLSLLHRSADLSEYSAMQRKLTAAKARSKKLKAELEELKRQKKGK